MSNASVWPRHFQCSVKDKLASGKIKASSRAAHGSCHGGSQIEFPKRKQMRDSVVWDRDENPIFYRLTSLLFSECIYKDYCESNAVAIGHIIHMAWGV